MITLIRVYMKLAYNLAHPVQLLFTGTARDSIKLVMYMLCILTQ